MDFILGFINRIRIKMNKNVMRSDVISCLMWGGFAALLVMLISLLVPFYWAFLAAGILIIIAIPIGIMLGIKHRKDDKAAALYIDSFGLNEQIITAYENQAALEREYGIRRLVISTYQSITGTGIKAVHQLEAEEKMSANASPAESGSSELQAPNSEPIERAYPYQIHRNLFPHGGDFQPDGYTTEEQKLIDETRKIFADPDIAITATVVRVPVVGGHSEAVNVELRREYDLDDVRRLIAETPGVKLYDDPANNIYPMPILSHHRDEVWVGRLRRDASQPNSLNLWIVADNIRKGAATNAIQIMERLIS